MKAFDFYTEHCREIGNLPEEWRAFQWTALGNDVRNECKVFRIRGAVAPLKTKGESKGFPNWAKRDKATEREFYITPDEHAHFLYRWEQKTGKCSRCAGEGKTLASCGVHGTTYRTCSKCGGTGVSIKKEGGAK